MFIRKGQSLLVGVLLILGTCPCLIAIRTQSIAVKGRLKCGDAQARNVRVKLFDEDSGPDPDDLLEAGQKRDLGLGKCRHAN